MPLQMYQEKRPVKEPKCIAIAAGKGGVGKSTVTANLAEALSRLGMSVGVLDCDLYGPSLRRMLPEEQPPAQRGSVFIPALSRMGIKMLSMAYFRSENEAAVMRGPIANSIIQQFLKEVDWGDLDFLLFDFPPGTGDIQLTLAQQAKLSGALLVTTPQEVSMMDVRKAKQMFDQVGIPILGVIENMSYCQIDGRKHFLFGQGGGQRLALEWDVPLLGEIPVDSEISRCGDEGESLFRTSLTQVAEIFKDLAKKIIQPEAKKLKEPIEILKLFKKSPGKFTIEWSDGLVKDYAADEIQRECPCARCREGRTVPESSVDIDVVESVGRYALKIRFSSGCSHGIYPYEMLR